MYPHGYDVTINSSIIKWTAKQQNHVWTKFMSNKDYYMRKYKGIDRFLHHENIDYSTFKDGIVNTMFLNDRDLPTNQDYLQFQWLVNFFFYLFAQHLKF